MKDITSNSTYYLSEPLSVLFSLCRERCHHSAVRLQLQGTGDLKSATVKGGGGVAISTDGVVSSHRVDASVERRFVERYFSILSLASIPSSLETSVASRVVLVYSTLSSIVGTAVTLVTRYISLLPTPPPYSVGIPRSEKLGGRSDVHRNKTLLCIGPGIDSISNSVGR